MEKLSWLITLILLCHNGIDVSDQTPRGLNDDGRVPPTFNSTAGSFEDLPTLKYANLDSKNETVIHPSPLPVISSCYAFIQKFSDAAAQFTKCSIMFSRPLRFCEYCVNEYLQAMQTYNAIVEGSSLDDAGAKCSDVVLGSDRIQIIQQTFKFISNIWQESYCDACFFGYNVNSTKPELNNATLHFMELSNETATCFDNFTHGSQIEPFVPSNGTIDPTVCDSCRKSYHDLNEFYRQLSENHEDNICMDIVDMMNYTRLMWSKEMHCTRQHVDTIPIILLSVLFCSLPILFYTANKIHGTKAAKKLLKQKRLRESQMTSSLQEESSPVSVTPAPVTT